MQIRTELSHELGEYVIELVAGPDAGKERLVPLPHHLPIISIHGGIPEQRTIHVIGANADAEDVPHQK